MVGWGVIHKGSQGLSFIYHIEACCRMTQAFISTTPIICLLTLQTSQRKNSRLVRSPGNRTAWKVFDTLSNTFFKYLVILICVCKAGPSRSYTDLVEFNRWSTVLPNHLRFGVRQCLEFQSVQSHGRPKSSTHSRTAAPRCRNGWPYRIANFSTTYNFLATAPTYENGVLYCTRVVAS